MSDLVFANMRGQLLKSHDNDIPDFGYGAQISWEHSSWSEIIMWTVAHFGLPGNAYITSMHEKHMTWWFQNHQDRMVFLLRNGNAQCVNSGSGMC